MGAALNAVYNNYLTTYAPMSMSRYDTHKKSELRDVYNSIVKINKESPWYLPTTSKDTQQYAITLKERARALRNTIAQLDGLEENGLLDKKSAFSSNDDLVSATYIGKQTNDEVSPSFLVEVKSMASSQENLGRFLPNSKVDLPADLYSFDVLINDMNYEFQFAINGDETNQQMQERLMRLINNSDIGLKASIAESEGQTSLRLVSEATGLPSGRPFQFNISDDRTSKNSGTVDYLGLDYTSRAASNAVFTVNGEAHSSSSNQFTIGKMFEIQLHGITAEGESVEIGLKTDVESLADNVSHLIGGYNDFLRAAASYLDSQTRSKQLVKELSGIANLYNNSLESTGFTLQEDGTLQVNESQFMETASQSEDISKDFGYLTDFSNALMNKSNQVSINPMDYVDRIMVAYKNPHHNFASPYTTSAYSGMMFNGYC